jgi:hypothetical protein
MWVTAGNIWALTENMLETATPSRTFLIVLGAVTAASLVVAGDVLGVALRAAQDEVGKLGVGLGYDKVSCTTKGFAVTGGTQNALLVVFDDLLLVLELRAEAVAVSALLLQLTLEIANLAKLALEVFNTVFQLAHLCMFGCIFLFGRIQQLLTLIELIETVLG